MDRGDLKNLNLTDEEENFLHFHPQHPLDMDDVREEQAITEPAPITSDYTLTSSDLFISVDASGGPVTIQLPSAGAGLEYHITKTSVGGIISVTPDGSDTIFGKSGISITQQWTSLHLKADTGNWYAV